MGEGVERCVIGHLHAFHGFDKCHATHTSCPLLQSSSYLCAVVWQVLIPLGGGLRCLALELSYVQAPPDLP